MEMFYREKTGQVYCFCLKPVSLNVAAGNFPVLTVLTENPHRLYRYLLIRRFLVSGNRFKNYLIDIFQVPALQGASDVFFMNGSIEDTGKAWLIGEYDQADTPIFDLK